MQQCGVNYIMLTEPTQLALQSALIDFAEQFQRLQHSLNLTGLSLHLAPDSCWISEEHDVEIIPANEKFAFDPAEIITRRPPSCHNILVKL